jgi:hypothetical protein
MFELLDAALRELAAADLSVAPGSLGDEVCELYVRKHRLEAQIARRLPFYERSGGWAEEQISCGAWLRTQTTLSHGQAASQLKVARTQERLPQLAGCWQAGRISFAHWQAVADGLRLLPEELWGEVDAPLAVVAPAMTARELGDYLRELAQALIPTPKTKDETRKESRRLSVSTGFNGMTQVHGQLTPEVGEKLRAALSAASRPDSDGELRMPNQRQADALEAALDRLLEAELLPADGGRKPHISLLVPLDRLDLASQLAEHDPTRPATPATLLTAEQRAELIATVTRELDAERAGTSRRPRFSWTGPTGIATARRLCCDGALTPIFTRGGQPLDAGRGSRTVPAALRALLDVRDPVCIWPGCGMQGRWTEIHHLWFWADGGPTNADTLGKVCDHHHDAAHSGRWIVVVTAPGVIRVEPRTSPDQPLYRFEFPVSDVGTAAVGADDPGDPTPPDLPNTSPDPHEHRHRSPRRSSSRRPPGRGPAGPATKPGPGQRTLHDTS